MTRRDRIDWWHVVMFGFATALCFVFIHQRDAARAQRDALMAGTERATTDAEACFVALDRYQDRQRSDAFAKGLGDQTVERMPSVEWPKSGIRATIEWGGEVVAKPEGE